MKDAVSRRFEPVHLNLDIYANSPDLGSSSVSSVSPVCNSRGMPNPLELNLTRRRRLHVTVAAEAAECGLACLAMVARFWGHDVDLNGLRQRFALSMSGATLRSIMEQASALGLSPRAVRAELSAVAKLKTPAILHWDLNHFVVLKSVGKQRIVIHDPAIGRREMDWATFSTHFTGVALELTPTQGFSPIQARAPTRIRDLWSGLQGVWGAVAHVLALTVALQIAVFAMPFQLQLVVDEVVFRADRELLTVLALGFGALVIVQAVIEALRSWTLTAVGSMVSFQIVGNLVRHMMRLPASWFEKRHVGDILSRLGSSTPIQDALTRGAITALVDGVMGLIAGVILFVYSPTLAGVVIAGVVLNLLLSLAAYPTMRRRMEEEIIASAKEQSHLMETVRAATIIKLMGGEATREAAWRNLFAETINASFSVGKFQIGLGFAQTILNGLQTVIVVTLAARMVIAGDGFSVGMLFAFLSFRQTFTDRLNALIAQAIQFRLLNLHLDRLGDVVQAAPDVPDTHLPAPPPQGAIELRNVSFRYGASDRLVLEAANLRIEPGEYVAFVGPSGSGKSTLLKLLLGLFPPTDGDVLLDGRPATAELLRTWRAHVGVVSQDDRLLSGSIADNIAFFDPDLDMRRVHAAAQAAQVHDEIVQMPMQYLSLVGDMGSSLSGGQKQRILLARALYRNPTILVLDEGTANLDAATEEEIARLIDSLPITRIIVAHRPLLIGRASRRVVVVNGTVEELER